MAEPLVQPLSKGVDVLRLDRCHGLAPGNKWFKLRRNIATATAQGASQLLSFGGAHSNHLHALAALGLELGWPTAAFIRADAAQSTPCMDDLQRWGMQLHRLSRSEYRRRHDPVFVESLLQDFENPYLIPEGGGNLDGAQGCAEIAELLPRRGADYALIMIACGTGTTLAGLAAGVADGVQLLGVPVLKAEAFMAGDIRRLILQLGADRGNWRLDHRFVDRGFGRLSEGLVDFIRGFESRHGLPLDPVYTAKLFYAVETMAAAGELADYSRILVVHSGGLQGRRGYPELFRA